MEADPLVIRLDELQQRSAALDATRFSPSTKLRGIDYSGSWLSAWQGEGALAPLPEVLTLNFELRLNLDISFSGADLLRLQGRG